MGPSVCGVSFSPDGQLLLANVQAELCSELRVVAALDGRQLFNVRFEGVCCAVWQPTEPAEPFEAPEFPEPEPEDKAQRLLSSLRWNSGGADPVEGPGMAGITALRDQVRRALDLGGHVFFLARLTC